MSAFLKGFKIVCKGRKQDRGAGTGPVKSKQQIADEYIICTKTLSKRLKEEKIFSKRALINPRKQEIIYKRLDFPNIPINS